MKKAMLSLLLAGALLLSGCSALLDRPYAVVSPHPEHPGAGEDASITVDSYPELVSAVLYFVSQSVEEGRIQLTDYDGDVETDLNSACLEVAKDDPLGAYAVDFIKNDYTRVLTTYEVNIYITYRRTPEQIRSLVNVTGASAIRQVLGEALADFEPEVALRVGYFSEDEAYIRSLIRQAYYDTPSAALGMPEVAVDIYPDHGSQRIVEIRLQYGDDTEALREKQETLLDRADRIVAPVLAQYYSADEMLEGLLRQAPGMIGRRSGPAPDGGTSNTAWDALLGAGGDDEGVALAFQLLCDQLKLDCTVMEGTLDGAPHFWNRVTNSDGESYHVDLSLDSTARMFTDEEMAILGYAWGEETPAVSPAVPGEEAEAQEGENAENTDLPEKST